MSEGKSSKARRLLLFFLISGITIGIVVIASSNIRTLDALKHIDLRDILALCILTFMMYVFDSMRIVVLSRAIGKKVPFSYAMKTIFVGSFFGAITPLQSGMLPAEIYMMFKYGIPLGSSISIDAIKRISTMGVLAFSGMVVLLTNKEFTSSRFLIYIYYYVIFFYFFISFIFLGVYFFPRQTMWLVDKILGFLHRHKVIKDYKVDRYVHAVADDYYKAINFFTHEGKSGFFLAIILTILLFFTDFIMAPVIIHGLGYPVPFSKALQAQIVLFPALYFSPTPGGSGVAEGGFALLFASFIPKYLIGISVVIWRVFTSYISVIIGSFLTVGFIDIEKILGPRSGANKP